MRSLIRSAVQLPFFTLPGVADEDLFDHTASVAVAADAEGFDAAFVMDHFLQLPFLGGPQQPMLEGYTLLAGLAARTERIRLGTLVTGVTYRNPALLAKMITTLDVISKGRAIAGLGAAWYEEEHAAFGYEFPSVGERFDLLEDAIAITGSMFRGEGTYRGSAASIDGAFNLPAPITPGGPPILVGGAGERRTLPLAVRAAAASNLNCTLGEVSGKMAVIDRLLAEAGRDRDTINVTALCSVVVADDDSGAEEKLRRLLMERGFDRSAVDDPALAAAMRERMLVGGVDTVAERMAALCGPGGLDGIVAMLPADAHDPAGPSIVAPVFRAAGLLD